MLSVRVRSPLRLLRPDPSVYVEIQVTNFCVLGRIVLMLELRPTRHIALKLHPIELLYVTLFVGLHETVELAVRNPIQYPSVGPNVLNRFRQSDPDAGITLRNNLIG